MTEPEVREVHWWELSERVKDIICEMYPEVDRKFGPPRNSPVALDVGLDVTPARLRDWTRP